LTTTIVVPVKKTEGMHKHIGFHIEQTTEGILSQYHSTFLGAEPDVNIEGEDSWVHACSVYS